MRRSVCVPTSRHARWCQDFRGNYPIGHKSHNVDGPNGAFEDETAVMPWVGIVSTVPDMFRLAEMFRCGGSLDGARLLSSGMIDLAARNHTGRKTQRLYYQRGSVLGLDEVPAYIGLGFMIRQRKLAHHMFGTLTSARTYGNMVPALRYSGWIPSVT